MLPPRGSISDETPRGIPSTPQIHDKSNVSEYKQVRSCGASTIGTLERQFQAININRRSCQKSKPYKTPTRRQQKTEKHQPKFRRDPVFADDVTTKRLFVSVVPINAAPPLV